MRDKSDILKRKIEGYLKKRQLFKSDEHKKFEKPFLTKARKNFTVANLLFRISEQEETRKLLNLASDFEMYDWVIIVSYYSMLYAAKAAVLGREYEPSDH